MDLKFYIFCPSDLMIQSKYSKVPFANTSKRLIVILLCLPLNIALFAWMCSRDLLLSWYTSRRDAKYFYQVQRAKETCLKSICTQNPKVIELTKDLKCWRDREFGEDKDKCSSFSLFLWAIYNVCFIGNTE